MHSPRVKGNPANPVEFKSLVLRSAFIWVLYPIYLHAQDLNPRVGRVLGNPLPAPPEVRSPFVLQAVTDPETGKAAFSFAGQEIPPVIHASSGQRIRLTYRNEMSTQSRERCVDGPCTNMTNLHFHGLHVSPNAPQDDVLTMMAISTKADANPDSCGTKPTRLKIAHTLLLPLRGPPRIHRFKRTGLWREGR
jgi:hypothetical protein